MVLVKKVLSSLSYLPVVLIGILGAYIVFHMWELSEVGRGKSSRETPPGKGQIGQGNPPLVTEKPSPDAVAGPSAE